MSPCLGNITCVTSCYVTSCYFVASVCCHRDAFIPNTEAKLPQLLQQNKASRVMGTSCGMLPLVCMYAVCLKLLIIVMMIIITTLSSSCARYMQGNSCLSKAIRSEHPCKIWMCTAVDNHARTEMANAPVCMIEKGLMVQPKAPLSRCHSQACGAGRGVRGGGGALTPTLKQQGHELTRRAGPAARQTQALQDKALCCTKETCVHVQ